MGLQRFYASRDAFTWPNGAVGYRPGVNVFSTKPKKKQNARFMSATTN